jgi:molybdopterin converting factor subunit 1
MLITVLFFASAREKVGTSRAVINLAKPDATLLDLALEIQKQYPLLVLVNVSSDASYSLVQSLNFAINKKYSRDATSVIKDGDEVALIPPISGG